MKSTVQSQIAAVDDSDSLPASSFSRYCSQQCSCELSCPRQADPGQARRVLLLPFLREMAGCSRRTGLRHLRSERKITGSVYDLTVA